VYSALRTSNVLNERNPRLRVVKEGILWERFNHKNINGKNGKPFPRNY